MIHSSMRGTLLCRTLTASSIIGVLSIPHALTHKRQNLSVGGRPIFEMHTPAINLADRENFEDAKLRHASTKERKVTGHGSWCTGDEKVALGRERY